MQAKQVQQLRWRKISLYRSHLPFDALPRTLPDVGDDASYASALIDIARVAPVDFGITVGRSRKLSELGVLGHVSKSCATIGEVFDLWMIYGESAGELITFRAKLSEDGAAWSILIEPLPYLPRQVADLLVDELCASFFVFAGELTGREFDDFSVRLSHPPQPGVNYAAAFPGGVTFGVPVASVTGPAAALAIPVRPSHDDPLAILFDQLGGDRAELQLMKPTTLQLYDFLMLRRGAPPSLGAASAALRVSRRTLVRRLAFEETGYGTVLDEFRKRYAMALAQHGGVKPKQIAHLIGFRSENSLRKAFKKWTGQPIGAWIDSIADDLRTESY